MEYLLSALLLTLSQAGGVRADLVGVAGSSQAEPVADACVRVRLGDIEHTFVVECRSRAPYRSQLPKLELLRQKHAKFGAPLFVAPEIGPIVAAALLDAGWSWADGHGNYDLCAPGLRLRQVGQIKTTAPKSMKLPSGPAARCLIRWLVRAFDETEPIKISALAQRLGVSQGAGSKVVKSLRGLGFVDSPRGLGMVNREALLHEFVRQYPGAGGHIVYAYSLDSLNDVTQRFVARYGSSVAISADVGPDLLAPWRVPTTLIVYARSPIDLASLNLVAAEGRGDANVILQYPIDLSMFVDDTEPRLHSACLADPTQMSIDLLRLGGDDRREAAGKLESWILM